ncbi:hypothetical protein [Micromonospora sp. NPDC050276]|uniref:hypothetical protein n=1 Tax=Micromonospora sp. NPDC050276 TaxID=3364278 RepID=UPI0037884144
MVVKDVSMAYEDLVEFRGALSPATRDVIQLICADDAGLRDASLRIVDNDLSTESVFRLLCAALMGAVSGDPGRAEPVCLLSRIWWAGAETLDDAMDGQLNVGAFGLPVSAITVASIACLTVLPQEIVRLRAGNATLERMWAYELTLTNLKSAGGQLSDVTPGVATWKSVMTSYVGKSGAAYGRDTAMVAQLAGLDPGQQNAWRLFGRLFGVLRQLANDRAADGAPSNTDVTNGTWTLLAAHAMDTLPAGRQADFRASYERAGTDRASYDDVQEALRLPEVRSGYDRRVRRVRDQLIRLLDQVAPPSQHRDLVSWMVVSSADAALIGSST